MNCLDHLLAPGVEECTSCGGTTRDAYGGACDVCGGAGVVEAARLPARPETPTADPGEPRAEDWMDETVAVPTKQDLVRSRIAAEGMWQPGVWIERDADREVYVVSEVAHPDWHIGPDVTRPRREYVSLARARSETERRCLISEWLPDGARLVGYRAPSWRRPLR